MKKYILTVVAFATILLSMPVMALDNLIVSVNEFTGSTNAARYAKVCCNGTFGEKMFVINPEGGDSGLNTVRDLVEAPDGHIWVFDGTFSPLLLRLATNPNETMIGIPIPGWSAVNQSMRGGIALWGDYVFLTDNSTGSGNTMLSGLIRYNSRTGAVDRFGTSTQPFDISVSGDTLYALEGDSQGIVYKYNLNNLTLIDTVTLPSAVYFGITVADNFLFTTGYEPSGHNVIKKFTLDGNLVSSLNVDGHGVLGDIDADRNGYVYVGTASSGEVLTTTKVLASYSAIRVTDSPDGGTVFVAVRAVPEPGTATLVVSGTLLLLNRRKH